MWMMEKGLNGDILQEEAEEHVGGQVAYAVASWLETSTLAALGVIDTLPIPESFTPSSGLSLTLI